MTRILRAAALGAAITLAGLVSGCETLFPRTAAGLAEDGLVGAARGFGEGVGEIGPVVCDTLDGATVTVVADVVAESASGQAGLADRRALRQRVCATFGAVPAAPAAPAE